MNLPLELPTGRASGVDVVAYGECSIDFIGVSDGAPVADGKARLHDFKMLPGGQAATVAVGCARQGFKARFVGSVGEDDWGRRILADLAAEGVEADVRIVPAVPSRTAIILVDSETGARSVLSHRHPSLNRPLDPTLAAAGLAGRILMVDATEPGIAASLAERARAAGIPTIVDVDAPGAGIEDLLLHIDVMIVAGGFARAFAGRDSVADGVRLLAGRYRPAIVVATLGPEGSMAWCGGQEIRTPAPAVTVVDTIGAGDAFRAGFVSGWLAAPAGPVDARRLLSWAAATAALNCRGRGAQASLPRRQEVEALV